MKNLKIELKWAIIFSIVALIWMVLENLSGLHGKYIDYHMYLTNLFAIPAIIVMVKALKDKKNNYYGGQMSYKQGLISGIIISLIIAFLSPITQWITSNVIAPEYFPNVIERSVELGYYKSTEEASEYFNFGSYVIQGAIGSLIMGILTTAIVMIFIRSKNSKSD
ncbi:DUF4199 domain-containing protein [Aegicerativicinus sediminis]|uniref:DUF4199 domain-containing protein n=1 Tax=Aegicerativicinus sediminis TaxID=2893202 RepID=UPI001E28E817|nr:DUF4199 domain-containing protein [Aegicerativicinus sediminis]